MNVRRNGSIPMSSAWAAVVCLVIITESAKPDTLHSKHLIDSPAALEIVNVKAEKASYRGRPAIHLLDNSSSPTPGGEMALVSGTDFSDGTIEVDVAGSPRARAPDSTARGFIGIAFRIQPDQTHFECIYIRPTNGRADDQLRRNHATQYESEPDFPWSRLRSETPGVYESYADLETGAWTKLRIVVQWRSSPPLHQRRHPAGAHRQRSEARQDAR